MATTRYVAASAGTFTGGTACNGQTAITVTTWNGLTLAAGDLTWICGTITASANGNLFNFGSNHGSSGNPLTLKFDTGAVLTSPYFANSVGGTNAGAITLGTGNSWIVVDGNNLAGTIQNTANGSPASYANQQASTGVSGFNCSHCTVQNLNLINLYVNINGDGTLMDNNVVRAVDFSGSNDLVTGNVIHDCGWCIFDSYGNGDTHFEVSNNNIYNMGHGVMFAAAAAVSCTSPCLLMHDNHIHDALNWGASMCPFHQDGLHAFGTAGSTMDGIYAWNNMFDGDWGSCPTGFIFVEDNADGGGNTPAHLQNSYWWNNVGIVSSDAVENTNGWFNVSSGESGVQQFFNNTLIGKTSNDNTNCFTFENLNGLTFENNVVSNCGNPIYIITNTTITLINYNFYGPTCGTGNCFILPGPTYGGSFNGWKSICHCDSNGTQNNSPLLNADGSPQAGSPVIEWGANLTSIATGVLATLTSDTSKGNQRVPLARPGAGTCLTQGVLPCWDGGGYQFAAPTTPNPPTGISLVVH